MKVFSASVKQFSDPQIVEQLSQFSDYDVFCLQNASWSRLTNEESKNLFECSIKYKNSTTYCKLDFSSQVELHDSICRAFGFPVSFEFQLKDEKNFVFYPNKRQFAPRNYQKQLTLGSNMNVMEEWNQEQQFIPNTFAKKIADKLGCDYSYFSGSPKNGLLTLSKHQINNQQQEEGFHCVTVESKVPVNLINICLDSMDNDEKSHILQQILENQKFKKYVESQLFILCGNLSILCKDDYSEELLQRVEELFVQNNRKQANYGIYNNILKYLTDPFYTGPRGFMQGCFIPTYHVYKTREDFIFINQGAQACIVDFEIKPLVRSDHNGCYIELHPGMII